MLDYFSEAGAELSFSLSSGPSLCSPLWGSQAQFMTFPGFVLSSLAFLSYTETHVVEYTAKKLISFMIIHTQHSKSQERGLLSLNFFIVNDSPKVMGLVVLGA